MSLYHGDMTNGEKNGLGIMAYSNNLEYKGEYKDGKWHGLGSLNVMVGGYDGDFMDGVQHGLGSLLTLTKEHYAGEFKVQCRAPATILPPILRYLTALLPYGRRARSMALVSWSISTRTSMSATGTVVCVLAAESTTSPGSTCSLEMPWAKFASPEDGSSATLMRSAFSTSVCTPLLLPPTPLYPPLLLLLPTPFLIFSFCSSLLPSSASSFASTATLPPTTVPFPPPPRSPFSSSCTSLYPDADAPCPLVVCDCMTDGVMLATIPPSEDDIKCGNEAEEFAHQKQVLAIENAERAKLQASAIPDIPNRDFGVPSEEAVIAQPEEDL